MIEKTNVPVTGEIGNLCFVIMPISDPEGYESGHFKKVMDQIFIPAIEMAGYKPHRVDQDFTSSSILTKIVNNLINAPMVLCDLSARNPNVLYELGIRQAFDKPVVLVHEKGSAAIFDVSDITTFSYRKERKYDEVLEDRKIISEAIKATAQNNKGSSVIQMVNLQQATLKAVENLPTDQSEVMKSMLSDLQNIKQLMKDGANKAFSEKTMDAIVEAAYNRLDNRFLELKHREYAQRQEIEALHMQKIAETTSVAALQQKLQELETERLIAEQRQLEQKQMEVRAFQQALMEQKP